jgi:hypothetical protein
MTLLPELLLEAHLVAMEKKTSSKQVSKNLSCFKIGPKPQPDQKLQKNVHREPELH